ncbi:MAG: collagen binding domain-containing protein, partial [[Clostridium] innocuum]
MQKKLKSIVMIFASILLCGSNMLSTITIKANVTKLEDTGYWHSGQAHNPDNPVYTAWFDHQKIEKIHVEQGVGVCSEPWEVIGDWGGYAVSDIQGGYISDIWYYAYVNTNQSNWNYAVGQLMVWEYLGYKPTDHNIPNYEKRKAEVNEMIRNMNKKPSFSGQMITVNVGESKTLTDTNGVLSDFKGKETIPKGLSVKRNGNKLTITASSNASNTSTYGLNKIKPEMIGQSLVHKKPGGQDIIYPLMKDPGTFKLKIQVNKYGALKITKQDEDGKLVPNTSFKVSKNADMSSPIGTYQTGSDGTVTVNDLAPATYYMQESAVPSHLILDKTIHKVSVSADKTASFTARNEWKKGRVQIRKVDTDSKKQVAGATYAIFNQQGQELQRLVTKASGYSMSGYLRVGAYYVQEVIAPKGYTLNKTKYPVTISNHDQTITVTGTDKRQSGTLKLSKADSETNKKPQGDATLQGAVYELRAKENILDPADQSVKYKKGAL